MRNIYKYILLLGVLFSVRVVVLHGDEVTPRIVALAHDEEYISLLEAKSEIVNLEDSLLVELNQSKKLYLQGGDDASQHRQTIVDVEQKLLDARAKKSGITAKINNIEQKWMLDNMSSSALPVAPRETIPSLDIQILSDDDAGSISKSKYASANLSVEDLTNFRSAESLEMELSINVRSYILNYEEQARLVQEYEQSSSKELADSIAVRYNEIDSLNRAVADKLAQKWDNIADNKSFAYALLMERCGASDLFEREEQLKIQTARIVDSIAPYTLSHELLEYHAERLSMVELEMSLSQRLKIPSAVDLLRGVRDSMRLVEFNYPPQRIEKRLFIQYEPIKFSTKARYTSSNPIPAGKVYEEGVIYRLLVGSFKSRQAATLFKGAYPISIINNSWGLLCYYLGGYATLNEAEQAREMLLKRGFKRPEVVEWRDGEMRNLTKNPRQIVSKYRIEINGASELSEEVRATVTTQGLGRELLKAGASNFIVGSFDNHDEATQLMQSLQVADSTLVVKVVEMED